MWRQAGNESKYRGLSTSRRPEDRDEFADTGQIRHSKRHVTNHGEIAEPLRDLAELDDIRERVCHSSAGR